MVWGECPPGSISISPLKASNKKTKSRYSSSSRWATVRCALGGLDRNTGKKTADVG